LVRQQLDELLLFELGVPTNLLQLLVDLRLLHLRLGSSRDEPASPHGEGAREGFREACHEDRTAATRPAGNAAELINVPEPMLGRNYLSCMWDTASRWRRRGAAIGAEQLIEGRRQGHGVDG